MTLTTGLLVVGGIVLGLAIGWAIAQRALGGARERAGAAEGHVTSLQMQLNGAHLELEKLRSLVAQHSGLVSRAQAERDGAALEVEKLEARVKGAELARETVSGQLATSERRGVEKDGALSATHDQVRELEERLRERAGLLHNVETALEATRAELRALQEKRAELRERVGALELLISSKDQELIAQKQWIEEQSAHLQALFSKTASDLLEEKASRFGQANKDQIETLMKPFQDQLREFRKRVDDLHTVETGARARLEEQISHLAQKAADVGATANNLAKAMLGNAKKQGNWGELQLTVLLEQAGFVEGKHFDLQVGAKSDEHDQRFADTVVWLPEKECLVIDSKATLPSWDLYCSTDDPAARAAALAGVVESMRKHSDELAAKDYAQIVSGGRSIPFTLMFIPIEAAGIEAFRAAPELFIEAQKHKVIMVTPTTLFCVLQLVIALWNLHDRQANALNIAEQGRLLLRKLGTFVGSFKSVGDSLISAVSTYERAKDQLQTGKGNLVSIAERMARLGVEAPKDGELARLIDATEPEIPVANAALKVSDGPRLKDLSS